MEGAFPKDPKFVIAVVPHTSNWDFFVAIGVRTFLKEPIHFVGKKELFNFLTSGFFKSLGGMPLDRRKNENVVEAITRMYGEEEVFRMAIAPEGTRKKVTELKTGFYYIAQKANVPIIPVAFNYGKKEVNFGKPFYITGDIDADLKVLLLHFKGVVGKIPENSYVV